MLNFLSLSGKSQRVKPMSVWKGHKTNKTLDLLILAVLVFVAIQVYSQPASTDKAGSPSRKRPPFVELMGGAGINFPRGKVNMPTDEFPKIGFEGGVGFYYTFDRNLEIALYLLYEVKGSKTEGTFQYDLSVPPVTGTSERMTALNYFTGSIEPHYTFSGGKGAIGAGIYTSYLSGMKYVVRLYSNGMLISDRTTRPDAHSIYATFDTGFIVSAAYRFQIGKLPSGIRLQAALGFEDIVRSDYPAREIKNTTLSILYTCRLRLNHRLKG
jgi:hypothetical protein